MLKSSNKLKQMIPVRGRAVLRHSYEHLRYWLGVRLGRRDPLTPPAYLIFVGGDVTNFRQQGEKWLQASVGLGGLQPDGRVLDVGCGVGRAAVALTRYLNRDGSYEGFDIVSAGIKWCRRWITPRFPNFRFRHADVFNKYYHPAGKFKASEYRFPYRDADFDLVILTSVFTHMFRPDAENYLAEIQRVMRPGGRCLITFFLLNDESLNLMRGNETQPELNFRHEIGGGCRTSSADRPEEAIAYTEEAVKAMYERCALQITEIKYGSWCGRPVLPYIQDVVVALKGA
ncbi:MAG TPA: class I SAM-dependent methyltransferase [Pyrinomonadaceae bacterium]|jgi:SAM-dependent methyltransferase|nr:class I SAM-dependent methyltransferase [Pyrinomonadaceae bacterium]